MLVLPQSRGTSINAFDIQLAELIDVAGRRSRVTTDGQAV